MSIENPTNSMHKGLNLMTVEEYSKMSNPEKILNIVKKTMDGAQPFSEIGNAYIGKESYPVDIKLPKQ